MICDSCEINEAIHYLKSQVAVMFGGYEPIYSFLCDSCINWDRLDTWKIISKEEYLTERLFDS